MIFKISKIDSQLSKTKMNRMEEAQIDEIGGECDLEDWSDVYVDGYPPEIRELENWIGDYTRYTFHPLNRPDTENWVWGLLSYVLGYRRETINVKGGTEAEWTEIIKLIFPRISPNVYVICHTFRVIVSQTGVVTIDDGYR